MFNVFFILDEYLTDLEDGHLVKLLQNKMEKDLECLKLSEVGLEGYLICRRLVLFTPP